MDINIVRKGEIWQYNPATEGYSADDVFHELTGSPAIVSSKLRLNQDEIITYDKRFLLGSLEFYLTIPFIPTAGDVRQFGFKNNDNKGALLFDITDDVFTANVYDSAGTLISSKTVNWDANWTATEARYRISLSERSVYFAINDIIVARFESGADKDIIDSDLMFKNPLGIYLKNSNNDSTDVSLINYA